MDQDAHKREEPVDDLVVDLEQGVALALAELRVEHARHHEEQDRARHDHPQDPDQERDIQGLLQPDSAHKIQKLLSIWVCRNVGGARGNFLLLLFLVDGTKDLCIIRTTRRIGFPTIRPPPGSRNGARCSWAPLAKLDTQDIKVL